LRDRSTSAGIIYSAIGAQYVDEAAHSASSSLRFNDVPHIIYCDRDPKERVSGVQYVVTASSGNPYSDKIANIQRLPFARTLYLDTDTHVAGNLDELFDLLERFEVAAAHAPGYTKSPDDGQSDAFYDFNTGVIALRDAAAVRDLLALWFRIQSDWTAKPLFPTNLQDQPAFRRAVWESRVSVYVLGSEYNYRSVFPGRLVGRAKIIHGRSTNYEKLAAYLNRSIEPRTFLRFPPEWEW